MNLPNVIVLDNYADYVNGKEVETTVVSDKNLEKGMHVTGFHNSIAVNTALTVPREKQSLHWCRGYGYRQSNHGISHHAPPGNKEVLFHRLFWRYSFLIFIRNGFFMKYVWASWGNRIGSQLPAGENKNGFKTRHVRGYGCAVTFSSVQMEWSPAYATYSLRNKYFEASFCRA
ncbi:MAG TPA: hypothetical protein VK625_11970 [Flavitalea sp.]|nr:hypothetical protein [Flavitalea sp.]